MTVKELVQSVDFKEIAGALAQKPYKSALLPMSRYREDYDIICSTEFSGDGGTITFKADGDSNVYMIEGDTFDNIVGMEVVLPDNNRKTMVEAAADIMWSAGPFGRTTDEQWDDFDEMREDDLARLRKRHAGFTELVKGYTSFDDFMRDWYEKMTLFGCEVYPGSDCIGIRIQIDYTDYEEYYVIMGKDGHLAMSSVVGWQDTTCANALTNIFTGEDVDENNIVE